MATEIRTNRGITKQDFDQSLRKIEEEIQGSSSKIREFFQSYRTSLNRSSLEATNRDYVDRKLNEALSEYRILQKHSAALSDLQSCSTGYVDGEYGWRIDKADKNLEDAFRDCSQSIERLKEATKTFERPKASSDADLDDESDEEPDSGIPRFKGPGAAHVSLSPEDFEQEEASFLRDFYSIENEIKKIEDAIKKIFFEHLGGSRHFPREHQNWKYANHQLTQANILRSTLLDYLPDLTRLEEVSENLLLNDRWVLKLIEAKKHLTDVIKLCDRNIELFIKARNDLQHTRDPEEYDSDEDSEISSSEEDIDDISDFSDDDDNEAAPVSSTNKQKGCFSRFLGKNPAWAAAAALIAVLSFFTLRMNR